MAKNVAIKKIVANHFHYIKGFFVEQERVTVFNANKSEKQRKNWLYFFVIFFAVLFFLLLFFSFCMQIKSQSGKKDLFKEQKIFYLVLEKTRNKNKIKGLTAQVENVGGAGYVIESDGFFKIVGYVYFSRNEAESVLLRVSERFKNAEIVSRTMPKIKRKNRIKIECDSDFLSSFMFAENVLNGLYLIVAKYAKSKISKVQLFEFLQKNKLEAIQKTKNLEQKINLSKNEMQLKSQLQIVLSGIESALSNCINELSRNGEIERGLKNSVVFLFEMSVLFRENLNKIK